MSSSVSSGDGRPSVVREVRGGARQEHAETANLRVKPILVRHLLAVRAQPVDVLDAGAADWAALEVVAAPQKNVLVAQLDQTLCPIEQLFLPLIAVPVQP